MFYVKYQGIGLENMIIIQASVRERYVPTPRSWKDTWNCGMALLAHESIEQYDDKLPPWIFLKIRTV